MKNFLQEYLESRTKHLENVRVEIQTLQSKVRLSIQLHNNVVSEELPACSVHSITTTLAPIVTRMIERLRV